MSLISVIVTSYNWPKALILCLDSLNAQTDKGFEVIIADDGSTVANYKIIKDYCADSTLSIKSIHHEDTGFRAGTIRNKAVAISTGEYIVFVDGDCILFPDFINRHRQLARRGFFVPGNRVLLSRAFTEQVIANAIILHDKTPGFFVRLRLKNNINRMLPFTRLPLGFLRCLQPGKWQKAMTCNLGMWKNDFLAVNGFDELFEGWGYEDSDLVIRLIHYGIKRKEGRFAVPVLHLWHSHNDKSKQQENYQRLLERLQQQEFIRANQGVSQYLFNQTDQ
jgi:glycosyltransferase involved in cell wall biosynthesis